MRPAQTILRVGILGVPLCLLVSASALAGQTVKGPSGIVVYSQVVDPSERNGAILVPMNRDDARSLQLLGNDLFMVRLPGGEPVRLTDHRTSGEFGGGIYGLKLDATGSFAVFLANRKGTTVRLGESSPLWMIDLRSRRCSAISATGKIVQYEWSPVGSTLAFEIVDPHGGRLMLMNARTSRSVTWRSERDLGSWAWWGTGRAIVYELVGRRALLLRHIGDRKLLGHWKIGKETDVRQLRPSPDGKRMLVSADHSCHVARLGRSRQRVYSRFGIWELAWSPNGKRFAEHTAFYDPPYPNMPSHVENGIGITNASTFRGVPGGFSWKDSIADASSYLIAGWSRDSRWLLVEDRSEGNVSQPALLALNTHTKARVELFRPPAAIASIDWRGN